MRQLKSNSVFILNIGDRKYPLTSVMESEFSNKYEINRINNYLMNNSGLGREDDLGEKFYSIQK